MALGPLAKKKIGLHMRRARVLAGMSRRRHLRAALVGKRALAAKAKGHHLLEARLMKRALRLKAMAVRAGVRAVFNRARIVQIRRAHRLHAQKHAG